MSNLFTFQNTCKNTKSVRLIVQQHYKSATYGTNSFVGKPSSHLWDNMPNSMETMIYRTLTIHQSVLFVGKLISKSNGPVLNAPILWPKQRLPKMTKVPITPLIIVRFLIRNQRWKAKNLNFNSMLSYLSLSERRRPY